MTTFTSRPTGAWFLVAVVCCLAAQRAWSDADTGMDPTNKHAWAENPGWANTAPTHGGVTVHFDGNEGYLEGLAWGENIGWIKFGDNTGGPYANDSPTDWGVNMDGGGHLSGYAWGENVGWVNLAPTQGGVTVNTTNGIFAGRAWGENIGWISFRGTSPDYGVRTRAFDTQSQGTPNWWMAQYGLADENAPSVKGVPVWREYIADTDPTDTNSLFIITSVSNAAAASVTFPSSSRRVYTLQRNPELRTGTWNDVAGQSGLPGTGGPMTLRDLLGGNRQHYRVKVQLSP